MKASDLLGRYKPAEKTVYLLLDGSLITELDRLQEERRQLVRQEAIQSPGLASKIPALDRQLHELEDKAQEATVAVTLRAIPGARFDQLKLAYPPTEEQWEAYRERAKAMPLFTGAPEVDSLGMAPALIGLSVVAVDGEPVEWDESDGEELWATLHDGVRADLLAAAWEVNGQSSNRPFFETGTDTTQNSGHESITQQNEESPSLSSVEGS